MVSLQTEYALDFITKLEKASLDISRAIQDKNQRDFIKASIDYLVTRTIAENHLPLSESRILVAIYTDRYRELTKNMPWRIK